MVAQPLSIASSLRLGQGSVLTDLRAIDAGIDHALLTRAEVLVEWVEENEVPERGDLWVPELVPDSNGTRAATTSTEAGSARADGAQGDGARSDGARSDGAQGDGARSAGAGAGSSCVEAGFAGVDELGARRLGQGRDGLLVTRPVQIAGEGAPMVADMGLVDLAATMRRSVVSATRLVGGICELAYRLPLIWERVRAEQTAMWRALRVAEKTLGLPWNAAAEVDAELLSVLGSCSWAHVDRCVQAALARHTPNPEDTGDDEGDLATADASGQGGAGGDCGSTLVMRAPTRRCSEPAVSG